MRVNRYHSLSITLHWIMAAGLLFMLLSGVYMVNFDITKADQFKLYQIHKASGVIMLWAIILRVIVRVFTRSPALPSQMSNTEKRLAKFGHVALYGGLILMPISGWLMVSASPFGLPTFVFVDWISWPHIPFVERNKVIEGIARNIHWITASVLFTMVFGHISAVWLHRKKQGIHLIKRMWWSKNQ